MQTFHLTFPLGDKEPASRPQVLAIGDFDGVHRGHQEVITRAVQSGHELGLPAAIMTFHPHPRQVMGIDKYARLLTPHTRKLELMRQQGVDAAYLVDFNEKFMRVSPEDFVERMLVPLQVNTVNVGFDFTFGYKGAGTPDRLCELAKGRFAVEVVRPFHLDGEKVSSSRIRDDLQHGRVQDATVLLGRPYRLQGTVVHGEARGRTIGFPTANIRLEEPYLVPANGVYAIRAYVGGRSYAGVMNIGVKPTFHESLPAASLEAHLFEFNASIYGELIAVELLAFIRPERKFASVQELIAQIAADAEQAKRIAAGNSSQDMA
ncbi:bifunctional riboflavin kinase/FAD synthetase [Paenibacillus filicis]|uniref:Riboflavin biosynthesis protein n=1 Tax=Paenibacillus gyeongsangnamensis TaxID=3388067 RepID=A0ABT4Q616_9BACL|nr:bifunctional riboflavin kinase/FAD synthetase [Paenibacillus filicis]MCZ8512321.1 bifunctional riboflavin kinase/FAD synthetase [Paenibacillus filicis]